MLKQSMRDVSEAKKTPGRFVPCKNILALQQLSFGSLWVRIIDDNGIEKDVILYGASSNAWKGISSETLFIKENGIEKELPASTYIVGFYEQRDLPPQFANIWDDQKSKQVIRRGPIDTAKIVR